MNAPQQSESVNPYAPPEAEVVTHDAAAGKTDLDELRRRMLAMESILKGAGTFLVILGCLGGLLSITLIHGHLINLIPVFAAIVALIAGIGLRWGRSWGRGFGIFVGVLGLLLFPIGSIAGLVFIYLLVRRDAKYILSAEYREVINQTPHVVRLSHQLLTGGVALGCFMIFILSVFISVFMLWN